MTCQQRLPMDEIESLKQCSVKFTSCYKMKPKIQTDRIQTD